ncbi:unnamed protein product [Cunninghamella echinulata]
MDLFSNIGGRNKKKATPSKSVQPQYTYAQKQSNTNNNESPNSSLRSFPSVNEQLSIGFNEGSARPTDQEIEILFEEAASRLNLNLGDAGLRDLSMDKKWWILCNENQLTKIGSITSNTNKKQSTSKLNYRSMARNSNKNHNDHQQLMQQHSQQQLEHHQNKQKNTGYQTSDISSPIYYINLFRHKEKKIYQ